MGSFNCVSYIEPSVWVTVEVGYDGLISVSAESDADDPLVANESSGY